MKLQAKVNIYKEIQLNVTVRRVGGQPDTSNSLKRESKWTQKEAVFDLIHQKYHLFHVNFIKSKNVFNMYQWLLGLSEIRDQLLWLQFVVTSFSAIHNISPLSNQFQKVCSLAVLPQIYLGWLLLYTADLPAQFKYISFRFPPHPLLYSEIRIKSMIHFMKVKSVLKCSHLGVSGKA